MKDIENTRLVSFSAFPSIFIAFVLQIGYTRKVLNFKGDSNQHD